MEEIELLIFHPSPEEKIYRRIFLWSSQRMVSIETRDMVMKHFKKICQEVGLDFKVDPFPREKMYIGNTVYHFFIVNSEFDILGYGFNC